MTKTIVRLTCGALCILGVGLSSVAAHGFDGERQALFQEFCLAPGTVAASPDAIVRSGRFDEPFVFEAGFSTHKTYPLRGQPGASVGLAEGSGSGIQCSVGIKNAGLNLNEDGSIGR